MLPKWGKVKKSTAQSLCGANLFLSIEINGNNLDDLLHNKGLCNMSVHSRIKRSLNILRKGVCRHCNNRLGRFFRERICFVASYPFRRGIIISITQTSHIKNSCGPRKINSICTKNDFKYPDYGVLNLILKISGIEARNFSTKLFISCSEIVKTSLAVLIRFSEKSDFFVNANALKFTQITLSLPKYTQKIRNSNVCS